MTRKKTRRYKTCFRPTALGTPVDNSEPIEPNFDAYTSVRLLLSTRSNLGSPIQLRFRDLPSINGSPFNPERPTRILIHGWTEDAESDIKVETSRELLELYDFNVIFVDWSEGANLITYVGARNRVPLVATFLASYIDFLVQSNLLDLNRLTIVGFSLGGKYSTEMVCLVLNSLIVSKLFQHTWRELLANKLLQEELTPSSV